MKGYERIYDQCSETPFLFNSGTKEMIVYDDAKSAGMKAVSRALLCSHLLNTMHELTGAYSSPSL